MFWTSNYDPNPGPGGTGPNGTKWIVEKDGNTMYSILPNQYYFRRAPIRLVQDVIPNN